jgi:hypothetical protein
MFNTHRVVRPSAPNLYTESRPVRQSYLAMLAAFRVLPELLPAAGVCRLMHSPERMRRLFTFGSRNGLPCPVAVHHLNGAERVWCGCGNTQALTKVEIKIPGALGPHESEEHIYVDICKV